MNNIVLWILVCTAFIPIFMKKKILVTEDDLGMQDVYKIILEKAGYEVSLTSDAQCIYDDDFGMPDIIILDRYLPGSDGLDVCRYLKSRQETAPIPVIMISSSPGITLLSRQAGADDSMEKPFGVNELLQKVGRWINSYN